MPGPVAIVSLVRVAELLAYLCAALAAGGNALANVMQRKASLQEAPDRPFGPRLLLDLVHRPSWLLGFGGLVASFGMQASPWDSARCPRSRPSSPSSCRSSCSPRPASSTATSDAPSGSASWS